jgi:hypothetical protein
MAYRKPFTPQQRREAIRAYRSFRKHLSRLRRKYPPKNESQKATLTNYAESIRAIEIELRKQDRWVDVSTMIRADAWARWLVVEYQRLWNSKD